MGAGAIASVLGEEGGEGADFQHAALVPRGVELLHLPAVDVGVLVPRLGLVVLPLPPPLLLLRRVRRRHHIRFILRRHGWPEGLGLAGFGGIGARGGGGVRATG